MQKFLLICFFSFYLNAQIKFKLIDSETLEPIYDALIDLGTNTFYTSDSIIKIEPIFLNKKIIISHINYGDTVLVLQNELILRWKKKTFRSESFEVLARKLNAHIKEIHLTNLDKNTYRFSDILTKNPLLISSSYGAAGSLQEIHIRGMDGKHSIILYEGVRLNDMQIGSFNLANIDMSSLSSIELFEQGASAKSGTDAMAGVLNLKQILSNENSISYQRQLGSFGFIRDKFSINLKQNNLLFTLNMTKEEARNDYPYYINNSKTVNNNYSNYEKSIFNSAASYQFSSSMYSKLIYSFSDNDVGVPGSKTNIESPYEAGKIRQKDVSNLFILKNVWQISNFDQIELISSYQKQDLTYDKSNYKNSQSYLKIDYNKFLNDQLQVNLFTEFKSSQLNGFVNPQQINAMRKSASLGSAVNYQSDIFKSSIIIRYEHTSFKSIPIIYEQNLVFPFSMNIDLKLQISNHYRLPTFNELYWPDGGNINLLAEEGINRSISFYYKKENWTINQSLLWNDYRNLTEWINSTVYNTTESKERAFVLESELLLESSSVKLNYFYNYFINNDTYQRFYTPKNSFTIQYELKVNQFEFTSLYKFSSPYLLPQISELYPYTHSLNASIHYLLLFNKLQIENNIQVNNILNQISPAIDAYPKINFNYYIGIKLKYIFQGEIE